MEVIQSKRLYINSKDRTNGSSSNFSIVESNFLDIGDNPDKFIKVSVLKTVIPYSFYSVVGGRNNELRVIESDDDGITNLVDKTIIFPEGNYNIIQLKSKFLELLTGGFTYTFSFDVVSHKIVFSIAEASKQVIFIFSETNNMSGIFGFEEVDYMFNTTITSPNVVRLSGEDSVFVKSNLVNDGSIDHSTGKNSNTLVAIPIRVPHYNLIVYEKDEKDIDDVLITNRNISDFHLFLTDQNFNHISLNGLDWEIVLLFEVVLKKKIIQPS